MQNIVAHVYVKCMSSCKFIRHHTFETSFKYNVDVLAVTFKYNVDVLAVTFKYNVDVLAVTFKYNVDVLAVTFKYNVDVLAVTCTAFYICRSKSSACCTRLLVRYIAQRYMSICERGRSV